MEKLQLKMEGGGWRVYLWSTKDKGFTIIFYFAPKALEVLPHRRTMSALKLRWRHFRTASPVYSMRILDFSSNWTSLGPQEVRKGPGTNWAPVYSLRSNKIRRRWGNQSKGFNSEIDDYQMTLTLDLSQHGLLVHVVTSLIFDSLNFELSLTWILCREWWTMKKCYETSLECMCYHRRIFEAIFYINDLKYLWPTFFQIISDLTKPTEMLTVWHFMIMEWLWP